MKGRVWRLTLNDGTQCSMHTEEAVNHEQMKQILPNTGIGYRVSNFELVRKEMKYSSKFGLTVEGKSILDSVLLDQENIVVQARAGTGKTTLLEDLAVNTNQKILYLVFNSANAKQARERMPANVTSTTVHSLAWRNMDVFKTFGDKFQNKEKFADRLARLNLPYDRGGIKMMMLTERTVQRYCQSSDLDILSKHVPEMPDTWFLDDREINELENTQKTYGITSKEYINKKEYFSVLAKKRSKKTKTKIVDLAQGLWSCIINPRDTASLYHDHYLKIWANQKPELQYDLIAVDEGQDSNGLTISLVSSQNAQKIWVGDDFQGIYGWRGAINALNRVAADKVLPLSQSFRFGPNIAEVANRLLNITDPDACKITGYNAIKSSIGEIVDLPYTVLCRTNMGILLYCISLVEQGIETRVVGGLLEPIRYLRSAFHLWLNSTHGENRPVFDPDIAVCENWKELISLSENDAQAKGAVKTVETFGYDLGGILDELEDGNAGSSRKKNVVTLSTVHKAKGLEWDQVKIHSDFSELSADTPQEEINLLYVAVTRAIHRLQLNKNLIDLMLK